MVRYCEKRGAVCAMKAIIIEDERDLAELLAFNLEKEGWQTTIALDGRSGL